jgi:hypothetical protein
LLRAAVAGHRGAGDAASAASKRRPPAEAGGREGGAKMPLVFLSVALICPSNV